MKQKKVTARAIIEWAEGLDHAARIYSVADSLEEAEEIEKRLKKALEVTAEEKE